MWVNSSSPGANQSPVGQGRRRQRRQLLCPANQQRPRAGVRHRHPRRDGHLRLRPAQPGVGRGVAPRRRHLRRQRGPPLRRRRRGRHRRRPRPARSSTAWRRRTTCSSAAATGLTSSRATSTRSGVYDRALGASEVARIRQVDSRGKEAYFGNANGITLERRGRPHDHRTRRATSSAATETDGIEADTVAQRSRSPSNLIGVDAAGTPQWPPASSAWCS